VGGPLFTSYRWRRDDDIPFDGHWDVRPEAGDAEYGSPDFCHQTPQAYPRITAQILNATLLHLACTGSTAHNGVSGSRSEKGQFEAQAQLQSAAGTPYGDADPDVVTLSLGANDINFADVVKRCYLYGWGPSADCNTDDAQRIFEAALVKQREGLESVLTLIRTIGREDDKIPLVALSLYFDPFPAQYPGVDCIDMAPKPTLTLSASEMGWLRAGLLELNDGIRKSGGAFSNVVVIPAPLEFRAHPFCTSSAGDSGPWAFGVSTVPSSGLSEFDLYRKAPFHPTAAGQKAIATDVAAALQDSRKLASGTNVGVAFESGARLSFDEVTTPGSAAISKLDAANVSPNTDFAVVGDFVEITASADYQGPITVSLPSASPARLYHYTGGAWDEVPSTFEDGLVSGRVTSLSPFVLGTRAPKVSASFTNSGGGLAPSAVSFDASGSAVQSGSVASYEWNYGDGTTAPGQTASHTFRTSGRYEVVLRVVSDQGAVAEVQHTVTITNVAPTARIDAPATSRPQTVVSLSSGLSSDPNGTVTKAVWDFGDGSEPVEGVDVTHTYAAQGAYTVTLEVLDDEGDPGQATMRIEVRDPPHVVTPLTIVPPLVRPTGAPRPDRIAPVVSRVSLTNRRFRVGRRVAQTTSGRLRRGTVFRYRLSESATVRIQFERALAGRRVGTRCRKPGPHLTSRRSCTRYRLVGTLTRVGGLGPNRTGFNGLLGRKALRLGSYRANVTARDGAGNESRPTRLRFTVAKR